MNYFPTFQRPAGVARHILSVAALLIVLMIGSFLVDNWVSVQKEMIILRRTLFLRGRKLVKFVDPDAPPPPPEKEAEANPEPFTPDEIETLKVMQMQIMANPDKIWEFDEEDEDRPVMHTFYHPVHGGVPLENAMTIGAWKRAWYQAGWNPRVLGLKDVEQHADYKEMDKAIRAMQPHRSGDFYLQMGYMRYFAMAANGGGFMSDYDVIPMNMQQPGSRKEQELPNGGNFTAYSNHVPALLSGTADEWMRMAKRIIKEGGSHPQIKGPFTDFLSMKSIIEAKKNEVYVQSPMEVKQPFHLDPQLGGLAALLEGSRMFPSSGGTLYFCHELSTLRGLHLNMNNLANSIYDENLRGLIMAKVMQIYHDVCDGVAFFDPPKKEEEEKETSTTTTTTTTEQTNMDTLMKAAALFSGGDPRTVQTKN